MKTWRIDYVTSKSAGKETSFVLIPQGSWIPQDGRMVETIVDAIEAFEYHTINWGGRETRSQIKMIQEIEEK